ncbi:MAG: hypothetical protein KGM16_15660 [Bacteroidota bacterium]|nr:hypothetical protein [Bacteroidota bacterium]
MKKIKMSIFAVIAIVMGIAASAFTEANTKALPKTTETTYWFLMDASGTNVTTTQVSDPSTLCPAKILPDCAREYNESQTEIVGGVRQVKSSQVNAEIDFRSKD